MNGTTPRLIIRMGTHAEKSYVQKTLQFLDGLIVAGNLLEATPGATATLLLKCAGSKPPSVPYYIDPMTYAFGSYVDPSTGETRSDLDWIKSDQKVKGETIRDFKRSYRSLADSLGPPFSTALSRKSAIVAGDFADKTLLRSACQRVAEYQLNRVRLQFKSDSEYGDYEDRIPVPLVVFAPYFYIEPSAADAITDRLMLCANTTASLSLSVPVHAVVCADESFLKRPRFLTRIKDELPGTGVQGVWFWFSSFREDTADRRALAAFRFLIESLSQSMEVYNMHGGYLSLASCKFGLSGVSHGIGYGEQKNVVPVIGQSTPTVRYYLPDLRKRLGVPEIERCFHNLQIETAADFHSKVCDCVVCRGVVSDDLDDFAAFGAQHYATDESKRLSQTPAAAKRCRFHFLLRRIAERNWIRDASVDEIVDSLSTARRLWGEQPTLNRESHHLQRWEDLLSGKLEGGSEEEATET